MLAWLPVRGIVRLSPSEEHMPETSEDQPLPALLSELDPERLLQKATDIATALVGGQFGAIFYKLQNERGECLQKNY